MRKYDTMQVCLNGHKITDMYFDAPEERQEKCHKCGEDTIHTCPECGEKIRGRLINDENWLPSTQKDIVNRCHNCGEKYPWAPDDEQFSEINSEMLDQELVEKALDSYEHENYQDTVKNALMVLESRVRRKGGFGDDDYGDDLMTRAFNPDEGPLTMGKTRAEKQGFMFLYKGVIQAIRNPANHRFIEKIDESYAQDVVHTVNLLLRLIKEQNDKEK